jgi:hypothetical protein
VGICALTLVEERLAVDLVRDCGQGNFGQRASGELADEVQVYGTTQREAQAKLDAVNAITVEASILFERKSKL